MNATMAHQKQVLRTVLLLNLALFAGMGVAGWASDSSALFANALESISNSAIYLLSLLAVDKREVWKRRVAALSGIALLALAGVIIADVLRRGFFGTEPMGLVMMLSALAAAMVNYWCMRKLQGLGSEDINVRAATTFSYYDFASTMGLFIAGGLVILLRSPWPDLLLSTLVAAVAMNSGIEILASLREERALPVAPPQSRRPRGRNK